MDEPGRWSPPVPPDSPGQPPVPPPPPPPPLPGAIPAGADAPNNPAVVAIALGATGLGLLLVTVGVTFLLTLPCSVLAWVFGAQGRRRVRSGETTRNEGLATAGLITGIIGTVLGIVAAVVWVMVVVNAINDPTAPWNP